ncbi:MAG: (d)CMP kinase [Lachnospiraceae bacterium]|nr:(d)CMP kinase [Lachnospiraceae bacterium]
MSKEIFSIAIDGPAGAGKSTIAKLLAKRLGVIYVDTGAMYRAMALYMLRKGVDLSDAAAVSATCVSADITIAFEEGVQQVILNGENVSGLIRTEEVSAAASKTSVNPDVRAKLVELQKKLAGEKSLVMDGRDIGTVVLPKAEVKIYLSASSAVRAKRRYDELIAKGEECDLAAIEAEIIERDERDMKREISPLKQAEDAILVDSSDMSIEEVEEKLLSIVKEKGLG